VTPVYVTTTLLIAAQFHLAFFTTKQWLPELGMACWGVIVIALHYTIDYFLPSQQVRSWRVQEFLVCSSFLIVACWFQALPLYRYYKTNTTERIPVQNVPSAAHVPSEYSRSQISTNVSELQRLLSHGEDLPSLFQRELQNTEQKNGGGVVLTTLHASSEGLIQTNRTQHDSELGESKKVKAVFIGMQKRVLLKTAFVVWRILTPKSDGDFHFLCLR